MDDKSHRAEAAWPIVGVKDHNAPSVFRPEALLREARRQRQLPLVAVPEICVLDPDGDVVRYLKQAGAGRIHEGWAAITPSFLPSISKASGRSASSAAPSAHRSPSWSPSSSSRP